MPILSEEKQNIKNLSSLKTPNLRDITSNAFKKRTHDFNHKIDDNTSETIKTDDTVDLDISEDKNKSFRKILINDKKTEDLSIIPKQTIINLWDKYLLELKERKKYTIHSLLKNSKLDINSVTIDIKNNLQKELVQEYKQRIIQYFRNNLYLLNNNMDKIDFLIKYNLVEDNKDKIPYTNKEKFDYLAQKNAILLDLYKECELDLDV